MRPILVFAVLLLLGLISAAPEPEYALPGDELGVGNPAGALVEIESSVARSDRLSLPALQPRILRVEVFKPDDGYGLQLASASVDLDIPIDVSPPENTGTNQAGQASLDDLCNALLTSAQNNDLPVPFFANLLWQESRLRADDVSKKGAKGIAQFMPEVAAETGLADPFDPMQAIPASARLLQKLRLQFGNLGFVAAAYNAGAHRVIEWLEHRASLPRETRIYVVRVTGLSVDTWRSAPVDIDALAFVRHLPCRSLPAFANVEQEQIQQMGQVPQIQPEDAKAQDKSDEEADDAADETGAATSPAHRGRKHAGEDRRAGEGKHAGESKHAAEDKRERVAEGRREHVAEGKRERVAEGKHERSHDETRHPAHDRHPVGPEASHAPHGAREKHKSA
jgi:Transglycosylase SLT domain